VTGKFPFFWQAKALSIYCVLMILAVLVATLWPFNFMPSNQATWLPHTNGMRFDQYGVVLSEGPLRPAAGDPGNSCSLELLLRAEAVYSMRSILNFYAPDNPRQFQIKQWNNGLVITRHIAGTRNRATTRFELGDAFLGDRLLVLAITSRPSGTIFYINGKPQVVSRATISPSDFSGQLVLGTSPVDYELWSGEVRGLVVYSKALSPVEVQQHYETWSATGGIGAAPLDRATTQYAFSEGSGRIVHNAIATGPDLEIPKSFTIPHKGFLKNPVQEFEPNWQYVYDVVRNIAGFMPLGFLICAYRTIAHSRARAILAATLTGAVLSFTIEVLQFYIPQRNSGITDILTNTSGAFLGALIAASGAIEMILAKLKSRPA